MLASSVGAVEKCVWLGWARGSESLDTMGHPGAREHDRMCFVGHDASPGEKRRGTDGVHAHYPHLHHSDSPAEISSVYAAGELGLLKEKQKSELRVSRRYIEVERERDSFRSG